MTNGKNKNKLHSAAGKWQLLRRRVSTTVGKEMSMRSARQMPFNFPTAFKNAPTSRFFFPGSVKVGGCSLSRGVKDETWLWVAEERGRSRMGNARRRNSCLGNEGGVKTSFLVVHLSTRAWNVLLSNKTLTTPPDSQMASYSVQWSWSPSADAKGFWFHIKVESLSIMLL